jgi:hypothetical protein
MTKYAANTEVPADRSRAEIEKTLVRYGATKFMYGWEDDAAAIGFVANGRHVRFLLPLPDKNSREFTHTPERGTLRSPGQALVAWEQACRQKWRALALYVKATLEAVESGIVTFEEAFEAHTILPNGQTVGQWIQPQIIQAYDCGKMPKMLPMLSGGDQL